MCVLISALSYSNPKPRPVSQWVVQVTAMASDRQHGRAPRQKYIPPRRQDHARNKTVKTKIHRPKCKSSEPSFVCFHLTCHKNEKPGKPTPLA